MSCVYLLVEGQTEEAFVKRLLAPALPGLHLIPIIVTTRRADVRAYKGGTVKYEEFERQIRQLLKNPNASVVTTMVDYQGMPLDFPGREQAKGLDSLRRAEYVEAAMQGKVGDERYCPFVLLHEFEALLYAGPDHIAEVLKLPRLKPLLTGVLKNYDGLPEAINDSPATSPSARIESFCKDVGGSEKRYQKRTFGVLIAERIGLDAMRNACPHFDSWVEMLEALAE